MREPTGRNLGNLGKLPWKTPSAFRALFHTPNSLRPARPVAGSSALALLHARITSFAPCYAGFVVATPASLSICSHCLLSPPNMPTTLPVRAKESGIVYAARTVAPVSHWQSGSGIDPGGSVAVCMCVFSELPSSEILNRSQTPVTHSRWTGF